MRMSRLVGENVGSFEGELLRLRMRVSASGGDRDQVGDKFVQARAGHDHRIASPMGFLADAQEATAGILAVVDDQELALHLELAGRDNLLVNHFGALWGKEPRLMPQHRGAAIGNSASNVRRRLDIR